MFINCFRNLYVMGYAASIINILQSLRKWGSHDCSSKY